MFKKYGPLFILLGLVVVLSVVSPYFLSSDNLITIAKQTTVIGILAIGELLTIITGGIDLTVGSTLAFSLVISALMMKAGVSLIICLLIAILVGAVVGYINGFVITGMKIQPFIATLGMSGVLRGAALIITNGLPVSSLPEGVKLFGNGTIFLISVPILIFAIIAILFEIMLSKTIFGRQIYALGSNREATRLAGINVGRKTRYVYVLSGILAAIAGILLMGRLGAAQPTAATGYESNAIAASVLGGASMMGGMGTVWGAVVGAFIMSVLTNGFTLLHFNTFFQQSAIGFILILAVYIDILQRSNNSPFKVLKLKFSKHRNISSNS